MKQTVRMILALSVTAALLLAGCGSQEPPKSEITPKPVETTAAPETTAVPETTAAPETAPEQNEELSLGSVSGTVYRNEYLGIGCEFGENWVLASADELQELPGNVEELFADTAMADDMSQLTQIMDMQAQNSTDGSNVNILYTKLPVADRVIYGAMDEEGVVDTILAQTDLLAETYAQIGVEGSVFEKVTVPFLGREHTAMLTTAQTQGIPVYILQVYDYGLDAYGVVLTATSFGENTCQSLLDLFYELG